MSTRPGRGGSSRPRASTTSSSCPSPSGWRSWWPCSRPCGTAPATTSYRRLTRFFGTLLLINVAIGVVTGLVQEFEFGMNWSAYSAYVGNVFGAPLAMEGLPAFFLESTFLGIWVFGWDRLPKRVHLACIWLVAVRHDALGRVHHGGQLLDAAPGRLRDQPRHRPAAAQRHLGACSPTRCSCGATCTCSWPRSSPGRWSCWPSRPGTCVAEATSTHSGARPPPRSWSWCPSIVLILFVGSELGWSRPSTSP